MRSAAPAFRRAACAAALALIGAPSYPAGPRSPLTVAAVSLADVNPVSRSIGVSIVRGSISPTDDYAVGVGAVHLPQGAIVRAMSAHGIDESASLNLEVRLFRRRISTGLLTGTEMAMVMTNGSAPAMQSPRDTSVATPTIENAAYVYWVAARLPEDTELFGIQVEYLAPLFLDGFESEDTSAWLGTVEQGFTSPLAVNFADAVSTTVGIDGCWASGDTGSTAEAYLMAGSFDGAECCFVAPVHLPHGVAVTAIISYVVDTGTENLTLSLRRKSVANQVVSTALATTTSSGSGSNVRLFSDGSIVDGVIDNDSYTYFLASDTCLDPERTLSFYQTLIFFDE